MSRRIAQRRRRNKRKRRRDRQRREPSQALVVASRTRRTRLRVVPGALEIARGHDGLLRGYPEPVLLVATYDLARSTLLTRDIVRYERVRALPSVVPARALDAASNARLAPGTTVAVIAVALEEDSSRDIQTLFSELAHADTIVAWRRDDASGESSDAGAIPGSLDHLREVTAAEVVAPIELKVAGRFPADWFGADDYIAAAATWIGATARRAVELEVPARSSDGRNDWRARLTVRFS